MTVPQLQVRTGPRVCPDDLPLRFGSSYDAAVTYDAAADELTLQTRDGAGSLTDRLAIRSGVSSAAIVVNGPGADLDLRVAGDNDQSLLYADASADRVGIGIGMSNAPDTKLHVHAGSAGSIAAFGSAVVTVENNSHAYLQFLSPSGNYQQGILFGDSASATAGYIEYNHNSDSLSVVTGGQERARVSGASLFVGDTGHAYATRALVVNQGMNDDLAFALKSDDLATGLYTVPTASPKGANGNLETDDYLALKKADANLGGAWLCAAAGNGPLGTVLALTAVGGAADTSKAASSTGLVNVYATRHNGSDGFQNVEAEGNVFAVTGRVGGQNRALAIVDAEGDLHLDASSSQNVWDEYDDVALITAYRAATMPAGSPFRERFAALVAQNREVLVRTGVLSEGGFVSLKALAALLIDAVRQLHGRVETRLAVVESRLAERLPPTSLLAGSGQTGAPAEGVASAADN